MVLILTNNQSGGTPRSFPTCQGKEQAASILRWFSKPELSQTKKPLKGKIVLKIFNHLFHKILIFADNVNFEKDETVRNVFRFGIGFEVNAAQLDKLLTKFLAALKKVDDQTDELNR